MTAIRALGQNLERVVVGLGAEQGAALVEGEPLVAVLRHAVDDREVDAFARP